MRSNYRTLKIGTTVWPICFYSRNAIKKKSKSETSQYTLKRNKKKGFFLNRILFNRDFIGSGERKLKLL